MGESKPQEKRREQTAGIGEAAGEAAAGAAVAGADVSGAPGSGRCAGSGCSRGAGGAGGGGGALGPQAQRHRPADARMVQGEPEGQGLGHGPQGSRG